MTENLQGRPPESVARYSSGSVSLSGVPMIPVTPGRLEGRKSVVGDGRTLIRQALLGGFPWSVGVYSRRLFSSSLGSLLVVGFGCTGCLNTVFYYSTTIFGDLNPYQITYHCLLVLLLIVDSS